MNTLLATVVLAGLASGAPVPKELKKNRDDAALIVGTWKPAGTGTCWYKFGADGTLRTWHDPNGNSPLDWTWVLEMTDAAPKRMKLTRADGTNTAYTCVYEIDGDSLKVGFVTGNKMPEKVEAGPGLQLYEQTRDTSAK